MSDFERVHPLYRLVETHHGDDLQAIAHREMGDANRWPELVWINELVWPYVTDDPLRIAPGVLRSGELIKVRHLVVFQDKSSTEEVYERDCLLRNKLLEDDGAGDFNIVAGVKNLNQQLTHAINTPRGQARRHPDYGCLIWRLLGTVNGPVAGMLGAEYVKATLLSDYRVATVPSSIASIVGDRVEVTATAEAITGMKVKVHTENG